MTNDEANILAPMACKHSVRINIALTHNVLTLLYDSLPNRLHHSNQTHTFLPPIPGSASTAQRCLRSHAHHLPDRTSEDASNPAARIFKNPLDSPHNRCTLCQLASRVPGCLKRSRAATELKTSHGAETSPGMGNDVGGRTIGSAKNTPRWCGNPCQHWMLSML